MGRQSGLKKNSSNRLFKPRREKTQPTHHARMQKKWGKQTQTKQKNKKTKKNKGGGGQSWAKVITSSLSTERNSTIEKKKKRDTIS